MRCKRPSHRHDDAPAQTDEQNGCSMLCQTGLVRQKYTPYKLAISNTDIHSQAEAAIK